VTFPSLGYALVPAAAFVGLATIEGQFITPTVLGHRLTLNPLAVLLALAFWAWLWGPMGAFLAVPLTIVILVTMTHLCGGQCRRDQEECYATCAAPQLRYPPS
jgi:predicted PurR-regulated permease PerM